MQAQALLHKRSANRGGKAGVQACTSAQACSSPVHARLPPHTPPSLLRGPAPAPACRDGCHHCGTRRGAVIGDHMPPNKYVKEYVKTAERAFFKLPFVKQVRAGGCTGGWVGGASYTCVTALPPLPACAHLPDLYCPCSHPTTVCIVVSLQSGPAVQAAEALAIPTGPPKQRYYPQCTSCCEKQSAAVRNDKAGWGRKRGAAGRGRRVSGWHACDGCPQEACRQQGG